MGTLTKRATVYFDPLMHRALQHKSLKTSRSLSDIVNDAVHNALAEDAEDLAASFLSNLPIQAHRNFRDSNHHSLFRWRG